MRKPLGLLTWAFLGLAIFQTLQMPGAQADPLRNVREVKLTIADLGHFGETCGLTKSALESAFFAPLRARGMRVVQSGTAYRIFIRATTMTYIEDSCVSFVDAQLLLTARYIDPASNLERVGTLQLWTQGGLHASDRTEHAASLNAAFRELGKGLASKWDAANK